MRWRAPDEEAIQKIIEEVQPAIFDYLEGEIADKEFLVADSFSIADVAVTCQFVQMLYAGTELPAASHPNVSRFITTHMQRDSFKQLINSDPFIKVE